MICFLICFTGSDAQTFKKNNFKGTDWFSDNTDSLFFKADTICLYRRMNKQKHDDSYEAFEESESAVVPSGSYVNLMFGKRKLLKYWENYGSMGTSCDASFTWKFNNGDQELYLLINGRTFKKLKPIVQQSCSIKSKYGLYEVPTIKWTFVRIK